MIEFYVYGEDGLTLKALKENLSQILLKLKDETPEEKCTIFYRPSFGRTRYYGEFDAIIISEEKAYLIESKWDQSNEIRRGLRDEQIRRHKILSWFKDRWAGEKGEAWNKFADEHNQEFKKAFPKKYIPYTHDSSMRPIILADNLQHMLAKIKDKEPVNVLMIHYRDEEPSIKQEGFTVITLKYRPDYGLYISLKE